MVECETPDEVAAAAAAVKGAVPFGVAFPPAAVTVNLILLLIDADDVSVSTIVTPSDDNWDDDDVFGSAANE